MQFLTGETCSPPCATRHIEQSLDNNSSESGTSESSQNDSYNSPSDDEPEIRIHSDAGDANPGAGVPDGNIGGGDVKFRESFDFDAGDPNQDVLMGGGAGASPEVQLAFDLGHNQGFGGASNADEEPQIVPEEEEDVPQLIWDQEDMDSDSEDEEPDLVLVAAKLERLEEWERFRIENGQYIVIFIYRLLTW
jgi:hypothetical protein